MRAALRVSTIALLLALPGVTRAQQAPPDPSAEMQKQFAEAYNKGDLDAMAGRFTEDAIRVTPSGIFRGREAIRKGFEEALKLRLHDYTVRRLSSRTEAGSSSMSGSGRRRSATSRCVAVTPQSSCKIRVSPRSCKRPLQYVPLEAPDISRDGRRRNIVLGAPMATLMVLYNKPADTAAFDSHYANRHIPLAKTIPGLRRYEVSSGPVATPQGPSPYHLVALLTFDSMEAIGAAFASSEGQATAADLANFAQAGAQLLMCETRPV